MPGSPPINQLVHERAFGSKEALEEITHWHEQTIEGQEETLDHERPARIVVQEKKTHVHEMETILWHETSAPLKADNFTRLLMAT